MHFSHFKATETFECFGVSRSLNVPSSKWGQAESLDLKKQTGIQYHHVYFYVKKGPIYTI